MGGILLAAGGPRRAGTILCMGSDTLSIACAALVQQPLECRERGHTIQERMYAGTAVEVTWNSADVSSAQ